MILLVADMNFSDGDNERGKKEKRENGRVVEVEKHHPLERAGFSRQASSHLSSPSFSFHIR